MLSLLVSAFVLIVALLFTVVSIVIIVPILDIVSKIVVGVISLVIFGCMVMDVQAITGRRGASGTCVRRWEVGEVAGAGCGNLGNPL